MWKPWIESTLRTASDLYNFEVSNLVKLKGGYENEMFGFQSQKRDIVIRITPPGHKQVSEVEAEVDFLRFLKERGAPVVEVVESKRESPLEVIETTEGEAVVVCFKWAAGRLVAKEDFSDELIQEWGKGVGMLHSLTKEYHPRTKGRIDWDHDEYLSRDLIPSDQTKVLKRFDALIDYFRNVPQDRNSFGLIHQDVHNGNLFWDDKKLTILDFDDCLYGYFVFDIANALGFSLWEKPDDMTNRQFADYYIKHFMNGYETVNYLGESWEQQLPYALKLFEFIHYNAFMMDLDLAGQGSYENLPSKTKSILQRYRTSIEQNLPYIENTFCPYR